MMKEAKGKQVVKGNQSVVGGRVKFTHRWRRSVITVALISMLLAACAAAGARLLSRRPVDRAEAGKKSQLSVRSALQSNGAQAKDGAHSVMLRSTGFDPEEMVRPVGRFTLAVDKESIREEVVMELASEDGAFSEQYTVPADAPNWYRRIQLQAGSYRITVANHPQWTCHITIE